MWELDYKESWVLKNWCFWTVVLEKTLESPLDSKETHPVHPKGNQSWIFIGKTDAEAETPILWPPDAKNWLIWKDPDAGKDWRWEEKGTTEDCMASPTQWTWVWVNSESWWWTGSPWGVTKSRTRLSDWTELLLWLHLWLLRWLLSTFPSSQKHVRTPPTPWDMARHMSLSDTCHFRAGTLRISMQFAASPFSALLVVEASVETEVSSAGSLSACDKHSLPDDPFWICGLVRNKSC